MGVAIRSLFAKRAFPYEIDLRGRRDTEILVEIFNRHCYRPPMDVRAPRVLDLGANIGLFAAYAISSMGAEEVTSVEADPANLASLRQFVASNDLPVRVIPGFAATAPGSVEFLSLGEANSRRVRSEAGEQGIAVEAVDVFELGSFDLAKIDIEGAEWELLADPRFPLLAPRIVMEVHGPDADRRAVESLERHGYAASGGGPVVWATRQGPPPLSRSIGVAESAGG